jgi:hypothetical protein
MLAGTVGSGVAPLAASSPDAPALIMHRGGQSGGSCYAGKPLVTRHESVAYDRLRRTAAQLLGGSRPSVRERSEHDHQ